MNTSQILKLIGGEDFINEKIGISNAFSAPGTVTFRPTKVDSKYKTVKISVDKIGGRFTLTLTDPASRKKEQFTFKEAFRLKGTLLNKLGVKPRGIKQ